MGSTVYHPQELATREAFRRMPNEVWSWYLYRRGVCQAATPNAAHHALRKLEEKQTDRFRLITQNVDGLHLRAGNSSKRTYQIHGNIDYMRCAQDCSQEIWPIPDHIPLTTKSNETVSDIKSLVCPICGAPTRPHVLWFDECYDEPLFRFESSIEAARQAALLIIIGTSAATNLPNQVVSIAEQRGAAIIDINIGANPFGDIARRSGGLAMSGKATEMLPQLIDRID